MEAYPGDVLEHALNKGIDSSAERYGVPRETVHGIVKQFASEVEIHDTRCPCEIDRAEGHATMCFMCQGPVNHPRILV